MTTKKLIKEILIESQCSTLFVDIGSNFVNLRNVKGNRNILFNEVTGLSDIIRSLNNNRIIVSTLKMHKLIILLFFSLLLSSIAKSQIGDQFHSWNLSYGRTGTPGDQIKAGLEYAYSKKFSIYGEPSIEWSRYQGLRYSSIGFLLGGRYYMIGGNEMSYETKINLLVGLNLAAEYNIENNLLKNRTFLEKTNYGFAGHVLGEYYFDQTIGFFIGIEQKFLFKKDLGKYNYGLFAGFRIHFGNY